LTAKATDNQGAVTTSGAVSVVVNASGNQIPIVTITSPANNVSYVAPKSFEIDANATDPDGTIANVDFYLGSTLVGSDNWPPYAVNAWNVDVGTYTLTVKATDNQGGIGTSSITVFLTDASAYFTTTANCFTPGGNVSFTVAAAQQVNAVNYWWSYSGTGATFSYAGGSAGYVASVAASTAITSGNVCVGITYSDGGYAQYCKAMNKCAGARMDDSPVEITTLTNNGANGDVSLLSSKDIASLTVVTVTGSEIYAAKNISSGQQFKFETVVPSGLHLVQILYQDGSKDIKKIFCTQ
jgi:hypothetical protein